MENELGIAGCYPSLEFCIGGLLFFFTLDSLGREYGFFGSGFGFIGCRFELLYDCVSTYLA